jgi:outer membrane usher protein
VNRRGARAALLAPLLLLGSLCGVGAGAGEAIAGGWSTVTVDTAQDAAPVRTYTKSIGTRLNPTGRPIDMTLPLRDHGQILGEIPARIGPDDSVSISRAMLIEKLGPSLESGARQRLEQLPVASGMVRLSDLEAAGFRATLDHSRLELELAPAADLRAANDLSVGGVRGPVLSAAALRPAIFSGYLNVFTGVDYHWGQDAREDRASGRADIESVFRLYNVVLENDLSWEGEVDSFTCPVNAICTYDHTSGLKRRRSRLIYDFVGEQVRVQVGDVDTFGSGFQRMADLAGLTIEKSPRKLAPGDSIRPTGSSSFRIERSASVEVFVNGAPVQRFQLRPGQYNLRDLPLTTGANDIELVITDDAGDRRSIRYTSFFDGALLAAGKNEWSVSGGIPSFYRDNERDYLTDRYFGTAFYRQGLTDKVTAEVNIQGDDRVVMGGAGVFSSTPWGFFGLQGAVSNGPGGTGFAVNINWALANIRGLGSLVTGRPETFTAGAEYRSTEFRAPGDVLETATGVLYAQTPYWLRLYASYSTPITQRISLSAGARYLFADEEREAISLFTLHGDRYGFDVTLASPINWWMTAAVTVGYSNELYSRTLIGSPVEPEGDLRVMARINIRPSLTAHGSIAYDTLNEQTSVTAHASSGQGVGRWEVSTDLYNSRLDDRSSATGGLAYYGNRAEVRAMHVAGYDTATWDTFTDRPTDQRSMVRVGTALAFADGVVGWGQPIRGGAFGIVRGHESLDGKPIVVGPSEAPVAHVDGWGPAIVPTLQAYTTMRTDIEVPDAPIGYSLGSGGFDTFAPYRAGYDMQVGSSYSVSAFGKLVGADGQPIALLTGTARPIDDPNRHIAVFTNAGGRFAAEGLAPGRWLIEMATEGQPTRFVLDVPQGTSGLFKAGTLAPGGRG